MHNNNKCVACIMYKINLTFEKYLTELSNYLRFAYSRFKCQNNNFPVERGARENIPRIPGTQNMNDGSKWEMNSTTHCNVNTFLKTGYCI